MLGGQLLLDCEHVAELLGGRQLAARDHLENAAATGTIAAVRVKTSTPDATVHYLQDAERRKAVLAAIVPVAAAFSR